MCGIAALISWSGLNVAPYIQPMTDAIRHRGPDDEGYALVEKGSEAPVFLGGGDTPAECFRNGLAYAPGHTLSEGNLPPAYLALGHRRLSILDLSPAGHQPMADDEQRQLIVYNGEVYNHVELRVELETLGHRFRSHSDTEVVLAAWRQWGEECLSRFNGMFAFVIVDLKRRQIFVARDRFGVKPLYWWFSSQGFLAFASEIKQFTVLPGWRARLNHARAYDYLNWAACDHTTETLFAGVQQLAGGEYLLAGIDDLAHGGKPHRWYTLRPEAVELGFEEAAARFRDLFENAVSLRLRADVPVGTGLSGGLDSSSIVCTVNRLLRSKDAHALQNTFSACAEDPRFDERPFIEAVVRHTGVSPHYTFPQLDALFPALEELVWHHDEPFLSTSVYAEWRVFELVRATGVKVTLDGHGADELLAGYHGFFGARLANLFKHGNLLGLSREMAAMGQRFGYGRFHLMFRMLDTMLPDTLRQPLRRLSGRAATGAAWLDFSRLEIREMDPFQATGAKATSIRGMSRSQLLHTSLPVQLKWADRDSMAHSVESRVPFLDYRLVEFALGCPDDFKIKAGVTKHILRAGLADRLPPEVAGRVDKMGFVTPESAWVRELAPERFRQAVAEAVESSRGVLTPATQAAAEGIITGRQPYDNLLWRWICFGRWMERFSVAL
jgi:asparagine synthase (glutamine-hydrolysing)